MLSGRRSRCYVPAGRAYERSRASSTARHRRSVASCGAFSTMTTPAIDTGCSTGHRQRKPMLIGRPCVRSRRGWRPANGYAMRCSPDWSMTTVPSRSRDGCGRDFPDDPEMWVSHETIYQSLYVQSRGALKRELATHLRTGRTVRKPHPRADQRRERFARMVMISERPAEVEDRAVPGHWEGDLILGSAASGSAVGTLVERATRFVMLLHLPGGHTADIVQEAMVAKMVTLPEQLRLSLTWDQGSEMANHVQIAEATGLSIYFCDPHSPWQRGSNENTNGLLRQYLPKGADLSFYGPGMLDNIAAQLNRRPRKTLNWRTPAEKLQALLSGQSGPPGVATTG